ncbi:MAG: GGDEF domain-containing protein [Pirellulales bacterium]
MIAYFVGRSRREGSPGLELQARRDVKRAKAIVRELDAISRRMKRQVVAQEKHVARFKQRLQSMAGDGVPERVWEELCRESEALLKPTQALAAQLYASYEELRQQSGNLLVFTEVRTDPLTGAGNRRALDESLTNKIALLKRYDSGFALVIVDIDHFKKLNDEQGHLYGDEMLTAVAKMLDDNVRDTDQVTRYGGEEFVLLLPHTPLDGASIFSNRLRENIACSLPLTVSIGIAVAQPGDTPAAVIARADAALYAAKNGGRNQVWLHNGRDVTASQREPVDLRPAELRHLAAVPAPTADVLSAT